MSPPSSALPTCRRGADPLIVFFLRNFIISSLSLSEYHLGRQGYEHGPRGSLGTALWANHLGTGELAPLAPFTYARQLHGPCLPLAAGHCKRGRLGVCVLLGPQGSSTAPGSQREGCSGHRPGSCSLGAPKTGQMCEGEGIPGPDGLPWPTSCILVPPTDHSQPPSAQPPVPMTAHQRVATTAGRQQAALLRMGLLCTLGACGNMGPAAAHGRSCNQAAWKRPHSPMAG